MYNADKSCILNVGGVQFYYLNPRGMSDYVRGSGGTDAAEYVSADDSVILYRSGGLWGARRRGARGYTGYPTHKTAADALAALQGTQSQVSGQ